MHEHVLAIESAYKQIRSIAYWTPSRDSRARVRQGTPRYFQDIPLMLAKMLIYLIENRLISGVSGVGLDVPDRQYRQATVASTQTGIAG
jgi:hypothetical protein